MTDLTSLRFEDVRFRSAVREHDQSVFVGYADATLVVPVALPGGEDLHLRIRGIQVKILNGNARIDFPSEQGSNGTWYPIVFPKSGASREALTAALLADPKVASAVELELDRWDTRQSA